MDRIGHDSGPSCEVVGNTGNLKTPENPQSKCQKADARATRFYEYPPLEIFSTATDINAVTNRDDVVQPLVGLDDPFDIAVTIWQWATEDELWEEYRRLQRQPDSLRWLSSLCSPAQSSGNLGDGFSKGNGTCEVEDEAAKMHSSYVQWYEKSSMAEKAIFSDIVFHRVRLSDRDIHTNITFQIPTQVFHKHPGSNYDLRASFMILPHSPSCLDYLKNYTSWFPAAVNRPRFKSFPFPLHSPSENYRRPVDDALDSFAITIPLLERHEVPSICPPPLDVTDNSEYNLNGDRDRTNREMLEVHPHIITRTQLRVVRESRLFRRDMYLAKHELLRNRSCGQLRDDGTPTFNHCQRERSYHSNVNWETMLQLAMPDPDANGGFREESAYAPFMDVLPTAAGPKDIIPVPINRERCDIMNRTIPSQNQPNEQNHMNITWHLSYSSVTPAMFLFGDFQFLPVARPHHTESEIMRATTQDMRVCSVFVFMRILILFGGSRGLFYCSKIPNYHPPPQSEQLNSVQGTLYYAAGDLILLIFSILQKGAQASDYHTIFDPVSLLMLWRILRRKFAPATHQERMSARLDARTDWRWKCGIFTVFLLAGHILNLDGRFINSPTISQQTFGEGRPVINLNVLAFALKMSESVMQLILNFRAKVFAGQYKTTVIVDVVNESLALAPCIPWIIGHVQAELMPRVSYANIVWNAILAIRCWQAWRYSSEIPDDVDAEDVE
ncbi:hypothetical protein K438DRAFT_1784531 [Mycena galopus ATCC 62051]|nr:hypothetical protein K438DRAFT_1784531 [Mycena galopus ATCC 62051]